VGLRPSSPPRNMLVGSRSVHSRCARSPAAPRLPPSKSCAKPSSPQAALVSDPLDSHIVALSLAPLRRAVSRAPCRCPLHHGSLSGPCNSSLLNPPLGVSGFARRATPTRVLWERSPIRRRIVRRRALLRLLGRRRLAFRRTLQVVAATTSSGCCAQHEGAAPPNDPRSRRPRWIAVPLRRRPSPDPESR